MIHGKLRLKIENDITDLVGLRTLVLSQFWQPTTGDLSVATLDAATPEAPAVPGGLLPIGQQTRQVDGGMRTFWTYQGIRGNGNVVTFKDRTNSLDYGYEPSFSQKPLETHPNFLAIVTQYGGYPDTNGRVFWPKENPVATEGGGGFSGGSGTKENPMYGQQDYFSIEGTYRFRYLSKSQPETAAFSGMIVTSGLPGNPPNVSEGRNWLLLVFYRRRGLIFDITEQYWLSGRGGWPAPLYPSTSLSSRGGFGANMSNFATAKL